MNMNTVTARPMVGFLRWTARVIVILSLSIAWFVAIGSTVNDPSFDLVGVALVVGLVAVTAVAVVAWFRERLGGIILIGLAVVGGIFAYLASTPNNLGAGMIFALPWLISGIFFIAANRLDADQNL